MRNDTDDEDQNPHDASDRDDPLDSDMDSHDEPSLAVCPKCRKMINEDAEQCHHCGRYLSAEDTSSGAPIWIFVTVVVLLLAIAWVWLF